MKCISTVHAQARGLAPPPWKFKSRQKSLSENFLIYFTGMRLGFGKNSGKIHVAIGSNPIQHCRF